jgi:hypothetical protein
MSDPQHTNRLIHETSPYLLQHAHNPVDWFAWGDEALARARTENKPMLVSIGYSACHWCHVMERESFENERIAGLMNELFVCVKVDREERPDLDHIYMSAVQMLTGHGGWPLNVFLTPAGEPFYGGTYFPPVDRHGMPAFPRVLKSVAEVYRDKPTEVRQSVQQILTGLARLDGQEAVAGALTPSLPLDAARALTRHYDVDHGGLGGAPKFPNTMVFSLFLRAWRASGEGRFLEMVEQTLGTMAAGGMYDQLGGGFHRYSVDARWLVPHFEKMLYDNALLARLYLEGFQATGDIAWRRVAEDTLAYVLREMTDPAGGFYSAQDADSEGVEGKYFVWSPEEVTQALGEERAEIFCRVYDVTEAGNFEGKSILHPVLTVTQAATMFRRPVAEIETLLAESREVLRALRDGRVAPGRDDKILTSWNGLMIGAFAVAYQVLGRAEYRTAAERAVAFVYEHLHRDGRLLRTFKDGQAKLNGYLDDYAFMLNACLDLYEGTFDLLYVERAAALGEALLAHFEDGEHGGFYLTSADHERLVARPKPTFDGSIPSGNSAAALGLLRLYYLQGEPRFLAAAERTLALFGKAMSDNPFGFANMLGAADFYLRKPREIVVVGAREDAATGALLERLQGAYLPNRTLTLAEPASDRRLPLAEGKTQREGRPTVYVCHDYTCSAPVTSWDEIAPLLEDPR